MSTIDQELLKGKTTITTESKENDFQPMQNTYKVQPFTLEQEQQALKDAEKSTAFGLIMAERDRKQKEYQDKLNNSKRTAKYLAWTNLFTNLAKLGGWGNAPVVKEDTTHLFKAFNDVDNVRNLMDQSQDKYDTALTNARLQYVESKRNAHNAQQQAMYDASQKYVDAYNKLGADKSKKVTTKQEYDPYAKQQNELKQQKLQAEIDSIKARKDLSEQQKAKIIKEMQEGKPGSNKPFYEFENKADGYTYKISKSKAVDIENYLADIRDGKIANVGSSLKEEVEDDLDVLNRTFNADMKDAETLRIISKYLQKYPDLFRDFINSAQRVKTQASDNIGFQKENTSTPVTSNQSVNSLIK